MNTFYFPNLSTDIVCLDEDESKHAVRVLRMKIGDQLMLVDGKGTRAFAEVSDDHPKRCVLQITERETETTGRKFKLHLAIAPTKNIDRLEWFVEKATEIGIDTISLINCQHSERAIVKVERLEKVAISAIKQSQQSWLPQINEVISFEKFIAGIPSASQKFIAHCAEGEKIELKNNLKTEGDIFVLIGPEGDFSKEEIELALSKNFKAITLGERRLRTETAALVSVMSVNLFS